ncbi:hypothetical protein BGZ70_009934 [Mortierella alpina]|uniref:BTB domain-containing protein n=1 Tax=Mortierella alpina TaxID=64518 RepID=A0A9P6J0U3_MORAP|nr:hypothetical protein BGZ70_009934 [Mortierella alpina]
MPHLSASRVLFEEGLYSDLVVTLQVPGSIKKTLQLHSHILNKESDFFAALLAGKTNVTEKAIVLLEENDNNQGSRIVEVQCMDLQELYAFESALRLLYTGTWCSDRDFQTSSLDARLSRGLEVMKQAGRLALKGSTTALLQEEITQMCQNPNSTHVVIRLIVPYPSQSQPDLLEKLTRTLRPEEREDDQAILKFDKDALQQMCRVAVNKVEIRDHCELVIARNLYGPKKFRDLRMAEVQLSELRPGYIFPPGGQESIYLLKGAPSLPLHPCRASNVEALRQVVDHYTAYNSQLPLRTREYYVIPDDEHDDDDDGVTPKPAGAAPDATFYKVAFTTGYQWLLDQVIKVRAPFELIILLLKDAIDENADGRNNVYFGEFATHLDGDVYLQGVSYIADGLLHAFQDPTLESFRNPGASGSLLNMISYGVTSLTDLPPLRERPKPHSADVGAAQPHQEYPALSTLVMEFFWQVLELALKRPHHLEFVQLLLDSITKIAPLAPFEVLDRIEERLAELLEETRKRIMEQRGEMQEVDELEEIEDKKEDEKKKDVIRDNKVKAMDDSDDDDDNDDDKEEANKRHSGSDKRRSQISSGRYDDFDDRGSMVSSVLFASEVSHVTKTAPVISTKDDDASSLHPEEEPEAEADAEIELPWMR